MIWNFHIAIELVLSFLTLLLAGYGSFIAYRIIESKLQKEGRQFHYAEKKYYLLSMIGVILLASRSVNVFYFYYVLVTLVPIIPGAMCPYGVLQANPIGFIDILIKLIIPFGYGLWLLLDYINKQTKKLNLLSVLSKGFLFIMFPLLILDSGLDLMYFWFLEPIQVNCCRNVYNEAADYTPLLSLSNNTASLVFFLTLLLFISVTALQFFQVVNPRLLIISAVLALVVTPLFVISLQEFITPLWIFASKDILGQPLGEPHHCPFCIVKRWPSMIPFLIAIWLGLASVGWQVIIKQLVKIDGESTEKAHPVLGYLRILNMICIIGGLLVLIGHYIFFLLMGVV